jgi:hypothetical protein
MPRIAENIFTQYFNSAVKMAARPTGVSRPELMGLGMSRIVADKVIESAGLEQITTVGRTDFFKMPDGIQAAVFVHPTATGKKRKEAPPVSAPDDISEEIQGLDKQIVEVRKLIAADCAEIAKIQARMIGHQSMLTALISQHLAS